MSEKSTITAQLLTDGFIAGDYVTLKAYQGVEVIIGRVARIEDGHAWVEWWFAAKYRADNMTDRWLHDRIAYPLASMRTYYRVLAPSELPADWRAGVEARAGQSFRRSDWVIY